MDRLTALRSFVEVANTASFTKAAENLDLSRLQVSRHVQEVESWLQQRLLHRTTRKVSLTSAGEEALIRCERILNEATALETDALTHSQSLSGTIRVSSPIGLAQNLLIKAITRFVNLHPQVTIDILASDRFSQLVDERVDIALRYTQQPADNLIARRLMAIDAVICAAPAYLAQYGQPAIPADLRQHNCFVHLDASEWELIKDNTPERVAVKGNIKGNELATLTQAALMGYGVIRLPCDLANPLIESGQLVPVLENYHTPGSSLWAVYLSRSYQLPAVRQFIDFLAATWPQDIRCALPPV